MLSLPKYDDVPSVLRGLDFLRKSYFQAATPDYVHWISGKPSHHIEDWFAGIPWSESNVAFHDYWTEVFQGKRQADCFVRFGDGLHELSHLILCADVSVLDPYYGSGEMGDPYLEIKDVASAEIEFRVAYVGEMLDIWMNPVRFFHGPSIPSFDGVNVMAAGKDNLLMGEREEIYEEMRRAFPTQLSVWNELERKRKIVSKLLG